MTMLGSLLFAVFLLAQVAAVVAVRAEEAGRASNAFNQQTLPHRSWSTYVALGAIFLSSSSYSQDRNADAHRYLQRHGVPCLNVLQVAIPEALGDVARCEDGREWALFWLEDEIAYVQPETREPYKWDPEVFNLYPEIYSRLKQTTRASVAAAIDR